MSIKNVQGLFLFILLSIFLGFESRGEEFQPWNHIICGKPEVGANFLEVFIEKDGTVSAKTQNSIFFLYGLPCSKISLKGPFFNCSTFESNETLTFSSFSITKNGYSEDYIYDEQVNVVEYHFKLSRTYRDSAGSYQTKNREFIFNQSDCKIDNIQN